MVGTVDKEEGFLFLKPKVATNADRIARAIAMCKGVKEVFLTSGEYGFVAAIEANANQGIRKVGRIIKKVGKGAKVSMVIKHYTYRKK